ncbi:hypothetical protein UFOVP1672_38 [uncultured Caudovirales phage]|uniref:Uncharacterized protein n=1 Tax=uncultured Caudovirales phage TaxID=2100421 RepID=A0A6J5Q363_9CAUD|nr:hypothetical protein UFOVP988_60 [uncultured Caudovirales phage]CAB4210997.1 hypothetical protein UFOVP1425_60 [uncultured Caudovirales phage]CAB4223398.1 hypothetical protein UFOVP1672_38 [uncultured Caudovirales phage]
MLEAVKVFWAANKATIVMVVAGVITLAVLALLFGANP